MNRLERIQEQEEQFDRLQDLFGQLEQTLESLREDLPTVASLTDYYETDWRSDYEADERGELPHDLKRGVLSQDGVFNLLADQARLAEEMADLAQLLAPKQRRQS